jgi:large subunit ribosomal protein L24
MMRIKKDDTVVVIAGKDKGKKGKVLQVFPKTQKVLVEGVNMITKHQKPNAKVQQGGIIHQEAAIHISNVMPFDAKSGKGVRVGYKKLEDGTKVRISRKTGEEI